MRTKRTPLMQATVPLCTIVHSNSMVFLSSRANYLSLSLCPPLAIIVRQTHSSPVRFTTMHIVVGLWTVHAACAYLFPPWDLFSRPFSSASSFFCYIVRFTSRVISALARLPTSRTVLFVYSARKECGGKQTRTSTPEIVNKHCSTDDDRQ